MAACVHPGSHDDIPYPSGIASSQHALHCAGLLAAWAARRWDDGGSVIGRGGRGPGLIIATDLAIYDYRKPGTSYTFVFFRVFLIVGLAGGYGVVSFRAFPVQATSASREMSSICRFSRAFMAVLMAFHGVDMGFRARSSYCHDIVMGSHANVMAAPRIAMALLWHCQGSNDSSRAFMRFHGL